MTHVTSRTLYRRQLADGKVKRRPNAVADFNRRQQEDAELFDFKPLELHPTKGFGRFSRRGKKRGNRT